MSLSINSMVRGFIPEVAVAARMAYVSFRNPTEAAIAGAKFLAGSRAAYFASTMLTDGVNALTAGKAEGLKRATWLTLAGGAAWGAFKLYARPVSATYELFAKGAIIGAFNAFVKAGVENSVGSVLTAQVSKLNVKYHQALGTLATKAFIKDQKPVSEGSGAPAADALASGKAVNLSIEDRASNMRKTHNALTEVASTVALIATSAFLVTVTHPVAAVAASYVAAEATRCAVQTMFAAGTIAMANKAPAV